MRIIAGQWRGRALRVPRGEAIRPTGDRAREAWMSIVSPYLPGARVIDLFAGSGALGLEALSRGAIFCDFVDVSAISLRTVKENAETLGAIPQLELHKHDAYAFVNRLDAGAYDLAFADPPYHKGLAAQLANLWLERPFAHILGVEHEVHDEVPMGGETRRYGATAITIYGRE
ncbi:MAG: 16S rRNA (guanine(966)-N(2))-methyltransferase RsmD [Gemmatimonadaceae bacterium]